MSLNIKNERAHSLAHQLADIQGISVTQAVISAMERDLAELRAKDQRSAEKMVLDLKEISLAAARHFSDGFSAKDIDGMLFDENGLPK